MRESGLINNMSAPLQQLHLPFVAIKRIDGSKLGRGSIDDRFAEFHQTNPCVYEAAKDMALKLKRSGRTRWSVKAIFEVLRYSHAIRTQSDDFKLNNDFTARYARLLMQNEPELKDFFELREIKSKGSEN